MKLYEKEQNDQDLRKSNHKNKLAHFNYFDLNC